VLFGSLLLLAVGGTASIDRKRRLAFGEHWEQFARATSNFPFTAIAAGRNQLGAALREIGFVRPLVAGAIYGAAFIYHARLFGVPAGYTRVVAQGWDNNEQALFPQVLARGCRCRVPSDGASLFGYARRRRDRGRHRQRIVGQP
jgi:hypothetical protein